MNMDALQKEVNQLKIASRNESDPKKQASLMKQYHKKALEFIELIHAEEKSRAGITATQLIHQVKTMPHNPKYEVGIGQLDEKLGGFETGLFINLAGESGSGKSTFLLEILTNISQSRKAVFFNFEMGSKLLVSKLVKMNLNQKQTDNLIIDRESSKLDELVREIELYAYEGIKFFVIDSKMKISVDGSESDHIKISKISDTLAKLAAGKDIIIFLINQMNEEDIKNNRLALKGSGDQKYDSDILFFITIDKAGNRKLKCTKNRMNDILFQIDITKKDNMPMEYEFNNDTIDMPLGFI